MTTILAVYNSRGCVGRCDANCYMAGRPTCHCICAGRNHGKGFACAEQNTKELVGLTPDDLVAFARATKRNPKELTVVNRLRTRNARAARKQAKAKLSQLDLFDQEETVT